jgi:hypothetical protein
MKDQTSIGKDYRGELARRLAAAWISCHLEVTLKTAYDHYVSEHVDVGSFWYEVADLLMNEFKTRSLLPQKEIEQRVSEAKRISSFH